MLTRREWLQASLMIASGTVLEGCPCRPGSPCEEILTKIRNRPMRRDITTLAPTDSVLETFRDAVRLMKALPATDPRNWRKQAEIHQNHCPHGNWLFLPWHRAYLFYFEEICRELTGNDGFALPYWNWSKSPRVPTAFWGAAATNPLVHTPRGATAASEANSEFVGKCVLCDILAEPNFGLFGSGSIPLSASQRDNGGYGPLEARPHNYIHGFVGGDMGSFMSPLDPLFWSHHNMIELCWYDWNLLRGNANTNSPDWTQRTFNEFVDRSGAAVSISVASMVLFPLLSYQYDGPVHADCATACARASRSAARASGARPPRAARQFEREEEGQEARRELRGGAKVRFGLANAKRVGGLASLELNKAQTIKMPELSRLKALPTSQRALLRLNGVEDKPAGDVFVRVFLNKPDATPDTSIEDPHYAGSLAFFGHGHHPRIFNLEITEAIKRASADGSEPTVQLVVVPFSTQGAPSTTLAVDSVEVGTIDESVVPSPQ